MFFFPFYFCYQVLQNIVPGSSDARCVFAGDTACLQLLPTLSSCHSLPSAPLHRNPILPSLSHLCNPELHCAQAQLLFPSTLHVSSFLSLGLQLLGGHLRLASFLTCFPAVGGAKPLLLLLVSLVFKRSPSVKPTFNSEPRTFEHLSHSPQPHCPQVI